MFAFVSCTSDHTFFFRSFHIVFSPGTTCFVRVEKKCKINRRSSHVGASSAVNARNHFFFFFLIHNKTLPTT